MTKLIPLLALLVLAPACKKQEDTGARPPAGSGSSKEIATTGDHISVLAHHKDPKPSDPVRLDFKKFRVISATFDPKNLEGGTATIELDLSSFDTGSGERDDHLKSPAYLDIGKLATAMITIDHVKRNAASYAADATVAAHGLTKTYPVTFSVLETADDRIRIKGEHTFARLDFGIGTDPAQSQDEQVGTDVTIEMVLTLQST